MGRRRIQLITSWDDYHEQNYRLADILKRNRIPAVWFIECNEKYKMAQIYELSRMGFEIGSHTVNHRILRPCPIDDQKYEIFESKKALEKVLQRSIRWFAYPRGRYSSKTQQLVKKAGYRWARTTKLSGDVTDDFAIDPDIHLFPRSEYKGKSWTEILKCKSERLERLHIWGHLKEIIEYDYFDKLEEIFKWLRKNYEIVYSK